MMNDNQVRCLRRHLQRSRGNLTMSAKKSGMDRKTARKYREGELPSELKTTRKKREGQPTVPSPFKPEHEVEIKRLWEAEPTLQATSLLGELMSRYPEAQYSTALLRTLQRRLERWRDERENFRDTHFKQQWHPGKVAQLDWTHATELCVTIGGEPFKHRLCHLVFPHSNWAWATPCQSESLLSLKEAFQEACWRAGGLPHELQTDNSSAATHRIDQDEEQARCATKQAERAASAPQAGKPQEHRRRPFNKAYADFMKELGVKPGTIPVRCSNANADVETANGHLKRLLDQKLILRGSRDFTDRAQYQSFLNAVLEGRNRKTLKIFREEEQPLLLPLPPQRLPVYDVEQVTVTRESLIQLDKNLYSVPSKLIGKQLTLWKYEDRIRIFRPGKGEILVLPRLIGSGQKLIDFRHLVTPLRRKPGAFRNYVHRQELFPGKEFRLAFDRLDATLSDREAERRYLEILQLAADHGLGRVAPALQDLITGGAAISHDSLVKALGLKAAPIPDFPLDARAAIQDYDLLIGATAPEEER